MNEPHPTQNQIALWLERHAGTVAGLSAERKEDAARDALRRRLIVLAGNKGRALELCYQIGYNPHSVHIITSPHVLRGLSLDATWTILRVGTWYDRRDLDQINQHIAICCMSSGEKPRVVDAP